MSSPQHTEPAIREGIAVVSAWTEVGGAGFRARITLGMDHPVVTTTGSVDEVLQTISAWLEELTAGA